MDRLSSCYFCGGALDASLAEYPVVPKALRSADADSPTVVLCGTCRRKLGAVVEEVVAAATDGSADGDALDDTGLPDEDGASGTASAPSTFDEAAVDGAAESDDAPADPGETSDLRTPSEGDPPDSEYSPDTPGETSDLRTPSEGDPPDSEDVSTDLGENEPADDGEADPAEDGPRLTKLEYNKVMRLLQNRPLPVDRAEIREVAASAYDIDRSEFDAVIDAAVERGLIAEQEGQFVEPT